jgi:hypothetical protein
VGIGDYQPASLAFELIDHLRGLPLRARQIDCVAVRRSGDHAGDEALDVGRWQVLHLFEWQIHAIGAQHLEAVHRQMAGQCLVVPLRIGRRDGDAFRADLA